MRGDIQVTVKGGPLNGHREQDTCIRVVAETPQFLAAIPGAAGGGVLMKTPIPPPPTVGVYELTGDREYTWRKSGEPRGK